MEPSDRLKKALAAGGVVALFPVLKGWSTEELQALIRDAEDCGAHMQQAIDRAWKKATFQPEVFLNEKRYKAEHETWSDASLNVLAVMSEICSVAIHYLHERGVEV